MTMTAISSMLYSMNSITYAKKKSKYKLRRPPKMILQSAIEEYLIDQQVRGNSPRTVQGYRQKLSMFMRFTGDIPIEEISLYLCKRYYINLTEKGNTSTTTQTYIRALRAFLTWCFNEGYAAENIPVRFKLPKAQRKTIDVLTDDEVRRLFSCFNVQPLHGRTGARDFAICALMFDSGLRLNEVVTLQAGNVHLAEGYCIVDGKGNKQRIVPLGLHSKRALIRYTGRLPVSYLQREKTPLFVKGDLTPLQQSTVKQLFRKLKTKSGIPRLRAHLLRHSFATRYLENGGDIYSLQQILGHTSLEMVKRYVHQIPQKIVVCFSQFSPLDNLLKSTRKP
jgi:integrase/recombinase XerC/integrase/recombinase XerD